MKKILLSLLLLFLFACNNQAPVSEPTEGPSKPVLPIEPIEVDSSTIATLPIKVEDTYSIKVPAKLEDARGEFTVKIEAENYTPEQNAKLQKAEALIKEVFNSQEYKEKILLAKFTSNKGMTNQEIYNHLLGGAEALIPLANYQMDLKVRMYYKIGKVVGYTTAGSMIVHTNSKFHSWYKPCNVASNLTHEWTHKMGYGHKSAQESTSVPYTHNAIIEELCPLAEQGKLTKIKPILLPQKLPQ